MLYKDTKAIVNNWNNKIWFNSYLVIQLICAVVVHLLCSWATIVHIILINQFISVVQSFLSRTKNNWFLPIYLHWQLVQRTCQCVGWEVLCPRNAPTRWCAKPGVAVPQPSSPGILTGTSSRATVTWWVCHLLPELHSAGESDVSPWWVSHLLLSWTALVSRRWVRPETVIYYLSCTALVYSIIPLMIIN